MSGEVDMTGIINVLHQCEEGFHEFTSPQIPGFYLVVERDDLEAAFDDIPRVIEELIYADTGIKVTVRHERAYSEYVETLPADYQPQIRNYFVEKLAA